MRANYTELAYFDNSKPDYGMTSTFRVGNYNGYDLFDNGVANSKNRFVFNTETSERVFDNSIAEHIQVSNKQPVIGEPSVVSVFDNSVDKDKQFLKFNVDKNERWFDNSINVFDGSAKPDVPITGPSTSPAWFDNNYMGAFDFDIGYWSLGVFDIFGKVSLLMENAYGYEETKADLDYPELEYNWFDNSIPSYKILGQGKIIPWGFSKWNHQFSFRFPEYSMDLQVDVTGLNKSQDLELQAFATPPIEIEDTIELSAEIELDKYYLELQLNKGESMSRLIGLQGETLRDRVSFQEVQYKVEFPGSDSLELSATKIQRDEGLLNIQTDIPNILLEDSVELQGGMVRHTSDSIGLQGDVLNDRIELMQLQSITKVDSQNPLELQGSRVSIGTDGLGLQYRRAFIEDRELSVQTNISDLVVPSSTEIQWFATPPIDLNEELGIQVKKVTTDSESLEVGFNIDRFVSDNGLEIGWLQSAKIDSQLELSFVSIQEMKVRFQSNVIPLGQTDVLGQARVLPVNYDGLGVQANVSLVKEYSLGIQNNSVIVKEDVLDVQGDVAEITKDYGIGIQAYNNVEKNYSLALQYILNERVDNPLELQSNASIEMEKSLELSADVTGLNKWYALETQLNVSHISKDMSLGIQGSVGHITSKVELGLQLDVLDLVYYMLYEGYNIVPWWSDGKGTWDVNVDKNWIKNDNTTTAGNGIRQQLDDMGLLSPDEFEMFDVKTRNFMYYNKLLDNTVDIKDSIVRLQHTGNKRHLTLGKSKKDTTDTIELKEGKNVVFYDGVEETFDVAIRQHVTDKLEHTLVWSPHSNSWELFWEDRPVYFYEEVNGKELAMPYVFVLVAKEDCTIPVLR